METHRNNVCTRLISLSLSLSLPTMRSSPRAMGSHVVSAGVDIAESDPSTCSRVSSGYMYCNGIELLGPVESGVPQLLLPTLLPEKYPNILRDAFFIVLVILMEHMANVNLYANKHRYRISYNRELVVMGAGNIVGSLFSAFAVGAGFSRSAVNDKSGAKSQLSLFTSGVSVLFVTWMLSPALYYLPKLVLSAIIFLAVLKLIELEYARKLYTIYRPDFGLYAIAFVSTLFAGVNIGMSLAIGCSFVHFVYNATTNLVVGLGRIVGTVNCEYSLK